MRRLGGVSGRRRVDGPLTWWPDRTTLEVARAGSLAAAGQVRHHRGVGSLRRSRRTGRGGGGWEPRHATMARVLWIILLPLVVACRSGSAADVDVAGAYAVIIDWFVGRTATGSELPVVFVVAQGEGFNVELSLQAAIISDTEDHADVRFIDDPGEAYGDDDRVRADGTLLAVGPAVVDRRNTVVDVDEVVVMDTATTWRFVLREDGGDWSLIEPPSISSS